MSDTVRCEPRDARSPGVSVARIAAAGMTLAAAPAFTLMAVLSGAPGAGPGQNACGGGLDTAVGGMTTMYLLMGAVHLAPWLRLVGVHRPRPERASRAFRLSTTGRGRSE
ncbi:hypothetical protein [Ensifer sp.]|jgi:hypothetical protein|uniref:hypothetical protein n=1 Tax=Ensifer sp. TaxID=1872086 RepID=UPI002E13F624|nr:hypothetical protein [Ensifer sp.]